MYVHCRARNAYKVEKRGIENMKDYNDVCRDIQQTKRIVERWMIRWAKCCLEQGDEDWIEWFEPKACECFNRRDFYDEQAIKISRGWHRMIGGPCGI